MHTGDSVV